MRWGLTVAIFLWGIQFTYAVSLRGVIYGDKNERLSYANIYVKGTSNGTSANVEGQYQLDLPPGNYEVIFQHLGYQQHIENINLQKDMELNVTLQQTQLQIRDVVINGNEDQALIVIRKAIAKRKYFLSVVESYSCDAYVKGMQRILEAPNKILGRKINTTGLLTGPNNSGILYLSESQSKLYYKKPNKFHEVIYSSKVSGKSNGFTFNSAENFYFNFYERSITIPFIAQRPFISPLAENAFFYYNYKMLGAYQEGDQLINKIQVTPKRKSDPCFTGVISIVENNWNIHSIEFYLTKENGIQYVDTLRVTQYFIPVKDDIWLPTQQRYDVKASFLGIKGDGYYLGIFKNYSVNDILHMQLPGAKADSIKTAKKIAAAKTEKARKKAEEKAEQKKEKQIFTAEVVKIEDDANKRDSTYWDSIRPIPLTSLESADYHLKDSIQVIRDSKAFRDSTDKKVNSPSPLGILLGYTYRKQFRKIYIDFPSLLNLIGFNTIEGVSLQARFGIRKDFNPQQRIVFEPYFRYGVTNKQFNTMGTLSFRNSEMHDETISLSGGRYTSQIDGSQPQTEFGNTWQTLVFKNNFMKLYEQYFIKATYSREIYNGIDGSISVNYAQRSGLNNTNSFSFFSGEKNQYTPNEVDIPLPSGADSNVSKHTIFDLDIRLHFTFGAQYISRPDVKFRMTRDYYPELTIEYKKAIAINGFSDQNFDFLQAYFYGNIPMKLFGTTYYKVGGGWFPNNRAIDYPDYKSFSGNFLSFGGTDLLGFYLIRYYHNTTDQYFAEAHIEHHFNGFLFNKIPGIRKLKLDEVLGFHFFVHTGARRVFSD